MKNSWIIFFTAYLLIIGFLCVAPRELNKIFKGEAEVYYRYTFDTEFPHEKLGEGMLVFCSTSQMRDLPRDYSAVSVTVPGDMDKIAVKLNLHIGFEEEIDGKICVYGYSPLVRGSLNIDGKRINVQIVYMEGMLKIGNPVIAGAF